MTNTSATGGYLTPTNTALDSAALLDFLHDVIAGITGIGDTLVRPSFQQNPPTRTSIDVDWCGFAIMNRRTEALSWHERQDDSTEMQTRSEYFDLLVSFYGPNCTAYAGILRDGLQIAQNLEQLFAAGICPNGTQDIVYAPELINDRYYERADITVNMNRDLSRTYDILTLASAKVSIDFDNGYEENFEVTT